ncbi:hypothetical protein ACQ4PT_042173 [Festuca glaucescens]
MSTGADSDDQSTSSGGRPRSDIEKDDLAGSDDDNRSAFQRHHGGGGNDARPEIKRRRVESEGIVVDEGALPSPTPSSERGSGGTISDIGADADAASLAQELLVFPCPICGREFGSKQAVSGHMRVHCSRRRQKWREERTPAIRAGSGKRGSVGCRSVSPKSKGVADSMAMVIPEPVIDPMPIASASGSSSAEPDPPNDDSMAIPVASSDNPTSQVVVHPPCSPQFLQGHQPAAPQVVVAQAQPSVAQGPQLAEAVTAQFVVHQPAEPQVVHRASPPPPARDEQGWLRCREKGCDHRRFATHEGLGSHMACHKIRQQNKEAAAASIPKKHGGRPKVLAHELTSALAPSPPAAMEVVPAQPAVAPGVPGVLRLFGVNIVPAGPPASAAEEVSAAVTETDESSASSTDIEQ